MSEVTRHIETCNECSKKVVNKPKIGTRDMESREINFFGDVVQVPIYVCGCGKEFFKIREALDDLHWRQMPVVTR